MLKILVENINDNNENLVILSSFQLFKHSAPGDRKLLDNSSFLPALWKIDWGVWATGFMS